MQQPANRTEMLQLLQSEISLWNKLQELCQQSPDGTYKADWSKFQADTGGYTINSLASYKLLERISIYLEDCKTYHIRIIPNGQILDRKIRPLIEQIDKLCKQHGLNYLAAFETQANEDGYEAWHYLPDCARLPVAMLAARDELLGVVIIHNPEEADV